MRYTLRLAVSMILLSAFSGTVNADQAAAAKSGCLGCHKADAKLVGPSFKDIAAKYAGQDGAVDQLAAKVKAGSQNDFNWGTVPMPASPAPIEDIKTVITWIMTQK
jgi:cytochrome c